MARRPASVARMLDLAHHGRVSAPANGEPRDKGDAALAARIAQTLTLKLGSKPDFEQTMLAAEEDFSVEQRKDLLPTITLGVGGGACATPSMGPEFQLMEPLGEGGMGVVVLARQRSLQREVAIKIAKGDEGTPDTRVSALMDEALVTGRLEHPNVIPVHAFGLDEKGQPVLVMKRVAGQSWAALLKSPSDSSLKLLQRDPLGFHLSVLIQVSNALHFAHSRRVVHRDLKPENVMIGAFGEIYLLDWGLAWDLGGGKRSGDIVGTLAYMTPEMLQGSGPHLSPRTDVYLLGAVLHRILTGEFRHKGESVPGFVAKISQSEPVRYPPSVPGELAELCNRSTSRDPSKRPASAQEFREAIELFLEHRSSVRLLDGCSNRFDALGTLLAARGGSADPAAIARAFAEVHFGLKQALEIWSENAEARSLLVRAVVRMCEYELEQRKPASAEALLAELEDPPARLLERASRLREELREEQEKFARLRQLEHQLDSRVSSRQRGLGALVSGIVMSAASAGVAYLEVRGFVLTFERLYAGFAALAVVAALIFLFERSALLRTRFNRDLMGALVIATVTVFLSTYAAQRMGLGTHQGCTLVMLALAVLLACLGVVAYRAFLGGGLCYLVGTLVALQWPSLAIWCGSVALLLAHSYAAWKWVREGAEELPNGRQPDVETLRLG
jgi:eukaryotic-like serine/threonine-protein kinase